MERVTMNSDISEDMAMVAILGDETFISVITNMTVLVRMYVVIM